MEFASTAMSMFIARMKVIVATLMLVVVYKKVMHFVKTHRKDYGKRKQGAQ